MAVRAAGIVTLFVVSLDDPQGASEGLEEMLAGADQALEQNGPSDDEGSWSTVRQSVRRVPCCPCPVTSRSRCRCVRRT